jgi:hypothetical protein
LPLLLLLLALPLLSRSSILPCFRKIRSLLVGRARQAACERRKEVVRQRLPRRKVARAKVKAKGRAKVARINKKRPPSPRLRLASSWS